MEEHAKHGKVGFAAMRSGMHRNTAARYLSLGRLPSETKIERSWRARVNPFAHDWPEIEAKREEAPELEAKTLFEELLEKSPERYHPGQVRTLQRRARAWRARHGPPKDVYFAQEHRPGEAMQTDFTWIIGGPTHLTLSPKDRSEAPATSTWSGAAQSRKCQKWRSWYLSGTSLTFVVPGSHHCAESGDPILPDA